MDWFGRGELLGLRGSSPDGDDRTVECRGFEKAVDEDKLAKGYKKGLDRYCDERKAWDIGFNGGEFQEREACSKEANDKAREMHAKGASDYCLPENGKKIGREGGTPRKKCGAAWDKQYKMGQREFAQLKKEKATAQKKDLRDEYYQLKRRRLDLEERKLRVVGHDDAAKNKRRQIDIELLQVDRDLLRVKQDEENLSLKSANQ
jgi:hypothetical protein